MAFLERILPLYSRMPRIIADEDADENMHREKHAWTKCTAPPHPWPLRFFCSSSIPYVSMLSSKKEGVRLPKPGSNSIKFPIYYFHFSLIFTERLDFRRFVFCWFPLWQFAHCDSELAKQKFVQIVHEQKINVKHINFYHRKKYGANNYYLNNRW